MHYYFDNNLDDQRVRKFADLALANIEREYPNKPSDILSTAADIRAPHERHPVFYGCFDWHSSVHGHWMLAKLLKVSPSAAIATELRALLDRQLTAEKLAIEAEYFDVATNRSFERAYGWAWVMRLATELHDWNDSHARRWSEHLDLLAKQIIKLLGPYLERLTYPIRTGVHPDTAFALAQTFDYAKTVENKSLEALVVKYCLGKYRHDRNYPSRYEPSGEDFFSPALNEADLMRRVLTAAEFADWLTGFLPEFDREENPDSGLLTPVAVSDITDPKIIHLAGLNLSRAWCLEGIVQGLPSGDVRRGRLKVAAARHREVGLSYVFSGHYEGEHWLATFAVYLITQTGIVGSRK